LTDEVLCRLEEIGEGEAKAFGPFDTSKRKAFVVRRNGRLYAWWDLCPHFYAPMAWRADAYLNASRDRIVCAAHGAEFEIETGLCVHGAALNQSLFPAPIEATPEGDVIIHKQNLERRTP
jgi:nitrite reductase/ring-hydroxylating ferredoxin subunit